MQHENENENVRACTCKLYCRCDLVFGGKAVTNSMRFVAFGFAIYFSFLFEVIKSEYCQRYDVTATFLMVLLQCHHSSYCLAGEQYMQ